jgi:hypothetical protein
MTSLLGCQCFSLTFQKTNISECLPGSTQRFLLLLCKTKLTMLKLFQTKDVKSRNFLVNFVKDKTIFVEDLMCSKLISLLQMKFLVLNVSSKKRLAALHRKFERIYSQK